MISVSLPRDRLLYLLTIQQGRMTMGFFDYLAKGAKSVGEGIKNFNQETLELRERYQSKSDDELKRIFKTGRSAAEKCAAASILKDRGYGNTDY
jgi:hypothetical protein